MIVMYWSSPDGEEYFGSPELFEDSKTSTSTWTKASIAWAYLVVLLIFKHFTLHVYNIANYKDILTVDDNYLISEVFYCIWVEVLVL